MVSIYTWIMAHLRSERGQDLLEYALLGGFIAIGFAIAAVVLTPGVWDAMVADIVECVDMDTTCPAP